MEATPPPTYDSRGLAFMHDSDTSFHGFHIFKNYSQDKTKNLCLAYEFRVRDYENIQHWHLKGIKSL